MLGQPILQAYTERIREGCYELSYIAFGHVAGSFVIELGPMLTKALEVLFANAEVFVGEIEPLEDHTDKEVDEYERNDNIEQDQIREGQPGSTPIVHTKTIESKEA